MKRNAILATIRGLAQSQGFYGRVLRAIEDNDEALEELEAQNFKDALDLVFFFEC